MPQVLDGLQAERGSPERRLLSMPRLRGRAMEQIASLNERALQSVLRYVQEQDGWEHVITAENVTVRAPFFVAWIRTDRGLTEVWCGMDGKVYRKFVDFSGVTGVVIDREGIAEGKGPCADDNTNKFACVKVRISRGRVGYRWELSRGFLALGRRWA
jgi:hypothetical protein